MGLLGRKGIRVGEHRQHRRFTPEQKLDIVLAGIKTGNVAQVCRDHNISAALYYGWREKFLDGGKVALGERANVTEREQLRRKIAQLERALGRKSLELEIAGKLVRDWE